MSINGWFQILLYCAIRHRTSEAARLVYDARVRGKAHVFISGLVPPRNRPLSARRHSRKVRAELARIHDCHAPVPRRRVHRFVRGAAGPAMAANQSTIPGGRASRLVLQHDGQFPNEYELAELRGREHAQLSQPDAWNHGSEFPVGRDRNCRCDRAHPRFRAPVG